MAFVNSIVTWGHALGCSSGVKQTAVGPKVAGLIEMNPKVLRGHDVRQCSRIDDAQVWLQMRTC